MAAEAVVETVPAPANAGKSFLDLPETHEEWQRAIDADAAASEAMKTGAPLKTDNGKTGEGENGKAATTADTKATTQPEKGKAGEDDLPADIKSEAGKSSWKRLKDSKAQVEKERDEFRTRHDAVTKERDTLNTRIADLEAKAKTPLQQAKLEDSKEYQDLKALAAAREKQLEEYSERLRLVDVEKHPKFEAYFKTKVEQQHAIAKSVGGDKALEILKLPPGDYRNQQLEELAAELTPMKQAQLGAVLTRLDEIDAERANEIAAAKASYATLQAQQKEQSEKQRREIEQTFQSVTAEVSDKEKGLSVFQEREGDADWNKGVADRRALAQAMFNGELKPAEVAKLSYWAAAAPEFLVQLNGALERNKALEAEISELRSLTPAAGGEKAGGSDAPTESQKSGLDAMMEQIAAVLPSRR